MLSYSYSAAGGTRTRNRCTQFEYEYEYHFIEYEYDLCAKGAVFKTRKLAVLQARDGTSPIAGLKSKCEQNDTTVRMPKKR